MMGSFQSVVFLFHAVSVDHKIPSFCVDHQMFSFSYHLCIEAGAWTTSAVTFVSDNPLIVHAPSK